MDMARLLLDTRWSHRHELERKIHLFCGGVHCMPRVDRAKIDTNACLCRSPSAALHSQTLLRKKRKCATFRGSRLPAIGRVVSTRALFAGDAAVV
jgi:hypothetical protein